MKTCPLLFHAYSIMPYLTAFSSFVLRAFMECILWWQVLFWLSLGIGGMRLVQLFPWQFFPSAADSQQGDLSPSLLLFLRKVWDAGLCGCLCDISQSKALMWKVWVIGWCHTNVAAAFLFLFSQALSPHSFSTNLTQFGSPSCWLAPISLGEM